MYLACRLIFICISSAIAQVEKERLQAVRQVQVPTEPRSLTRGQRVTTSHKPLYPSYCFVEMVMGPDAYAAVRKTRGVLNFVGMDSGVPNKSGAGLTGQRGSVRFA